MAFYKACYDIYHGAYHEIREKIMDQYICIWKTNDDERSFEEAWKDYSYKNLNDSLQLVYVNNFINHVIKQKCMRTIIEFGQILL